MEWQQRQQASGLRLLETRQPYRAGFLVRATRAPTCAARAGESVLTHDPSELAEWIQREVEVARRRTAARDRRRLLRGLLFACFAMIAAAIVLIGIAKIALALAG